MAVPTAAEFLAEYPEFGAASSAAVLAVVNAEIARAVARLDPAVWGDAYTEGVKAKTAQLLARRPAGRGMRLEKSMATAFDEDFRQLKRRVVNAFRTGGRS